tara:strand:+ start:149 stop:673 length:525 start_codon:yes stop_codon:yes gene_type:complete
MEYIANDIDELHYNLADDEINPEPIDESKADALLYCIGKEQSGMNDVRMQAQKQIDKIKLWEEVQTAKHQKVIDGMEIRLQSYFIALVVDNPDLKTKSMVNGTMKVRKRQPLITVEDEGLFLQKDNGDLTRIVPASLAPDKNAIKKYIKETGDIPEGISVEERDDKFSITINEG